MQQNQVYVIQVNTKNKGGPLALPAPPGALLPSEVKYSASLVRGLGCTHLVLGAVLFLLGVLGSWVEPETCWTGAGIWGGISTIICGICGLLAYHLWYKNYTIKAFLVTSVVCVVISILAIVLTIYGLINRYEHYYHLVERAEKYPWFRPYNQDQEQQLTLSVSANQLVGFILELILAIWSVKIGWKGVRAEEFSSSRRDVMCDDLQSVVSVPHHNGQQVPLAALYQLLQAHPELLGAKNINGSLGSPWIAGLDERPSHRSMDYQERVSRFLSHAIEDHNASFSRSPSVFQGEIQESSPLTVPSSVAGGSGGRGSPSGGSADTLVMSPDAGKEGNQSTSHEESNEKKVTQAEPGQTDTLKSKAKSQITRHRPDGEPKGKAPTPKDMKQNKANEKVEERKQEALKVTSSEHQTESPIAAHEDKSETALTEKPTKNSMENKDNKSSTEEKIEQSLSKPREKEIITKSNPLESAQVLSEENSENNSSKSKSKAKDTKKKSKDRSSSKEKKVEAPPPPNTEKDNERNQLNTKDASPAEVMKENNECKPSDKVTKESKKKSKENRSKSTERTEKSPSKESKEKRSLSSERIEEAPSQKQNEKRSKSTERIEEAHSQNNKEKRSPSTERIEEATSQKHKEKRSTSTEKTEEAPSRKQKEKRSMSAERIKDESSQKQEQKDKTSTTALKDNKSHKGETHKSSTKEDNNVNGEEKVNDTKESIQKENRKNEETSTKEGVPKEIIQDESDTKIKNISPLKNSDAVPNEKVKKSKKSKRDKESGGKSKKSKEKTDSNTFPEETPKEVTGIMDAKNDKQIITKAMDDSKVTKDAPGQVLDIEPPSEFQDS